MNTTKCNGCVSTPDKFAGCCFNCPWYDAIGICLWSNEAIPIKCPICKLGVN